MPRKASHSSRSSARAAVEKNFQEQSTTLAPEKHNESYQLSIPKNYTPFYVLLLVVISFLLGALTVKSQYLETKNGQANAVLAANNQQQPNQPSAPPAKVDVANGHFPALGNANAKVTIVAFEDFRCPFCKKYNDETLSQLKKDYIDTGKVKYYYRHYAFLGPASTIAANASECANDQGKFWDFHDYIFKHQPDESDTSMFTADKLSPIAGDLGMDTNQFKSCLDANKDQKNVDADIADAQKAGVSGTPSFFIDGNSLVGAQPYSAFKTIIDQELAKK